MTDGIITEPDCHPSYQPNHCPHPKSQEHSSNTMGNMSEDANAVTDDKATSSTPLSNATGGGKAIKETRQAFPVKVYDMLEDALEKHFDHIVSWNAAGTGFMVHKKDLFIHQIVPQYFNQTRYKSFQRQLSLYGFQRVTNGPNKGLRHHEKLRRGRQDLVREMKPVGYKPRGTLKIMEQTQREQSQQQDQTAEEPQGDVPMVSVVPGLPTVISSGSLDKHHQDAVATAVTAAIAQGPPAHLITPVTSEGEESSSEDHQDEINPKLEKAVFEGMSFILWLPPNRYSLSFSQHHHFPSLTLHHQKRQSLGRSS